MVAIKQKFSYLDDGSIDIETWLQKMRDQHQLENIDLLKKAFALSAHTSKGLTTFYGQPCVEQGLEMAEIILDLKLDQECVAAAMLASTASHTTLSADTIKLELNENIAKLTTGFLQMNAINNLAKIRDQIQVERLRKILLAMVSDIRVVLIKLAERTCLMRGIKKININERKRLALETRDIYAPLANQLGIGQLKWELEDFAFHYIDPETYKWIAQLLAERRADREHRIQDIVARLKENFSSSHIRADIFGRAKHIYSIFLKMQRKQSDYKNIFDCSAVRILVPTIEDCYTALSIVHRLWEAIPEEFDDYIANPKPNGYRSIHTAVIGPDGKNLEIQIRSRDMNEEAEHGVAAHWIYKENQPKKSGYENKINFLRQLLAWHKSVAKQDELPRAQLDDRVYVFTPNGDIIDLVQGATPLDFAYHIHSELGHRCRGAKINGHIVQLTHALQTGDQVEIITTKIGGPSRDWLNKELGFLKTARARAKVSQWFKQQEEEQHPEKKLQLEREVHRTAVPTPPSLAIKKAPSPSGLQIAGINHLLTRIAMCCKPIPGDEIIGYITQGRGVSIHKKECSNLSQLTSEHDSRLMQVTWNSEYPGTYFVDLQIRAQNRDDSLREITALLANLKINLISLNSLANNKNNMIYVAVTVQLHDLAQLKQLMNQLQHLPHIIDVRRTSPTS